MSVVVAVVLGAGWLSAQQGIGTRIVADVPFGFVAGGTSLPTGEYVVGEVNNAVLMVIGKDSTKKALVFTVGRAQTKGEAEAKLVFRRYGDTYFLAEVWRGDTNGSLIPRTKQEKDVALIAASKGERVTVAGVR
jgi:hypothetical protein